MIHYSSYSVDSKTDTKSPEVKSKSESGSDKPKENQKSKNICLAIQLNKNKPEVQEKLRKQLGETRGKESATQIANKCLKDTLGPGALEVECTIKDAHKDKSKTEKAEEKKTEPKKAEATKPEPKKVEATKTEVKKAEPSKEIKKTASAPAIVETTKSEQSFISKICPPQICAAFKEIMKKLPFGGSSSSDTKISKVKKAAPKPPPSVKEKKAAHVPKTESKAKKPEVKKEAITKEKEEKKPAKAETAKMAPTKKDIPVEETARPVVENKVTKTCKQEPIKEEPQQVCQQKKPEKQTCKPEPMTCPPWIQGDQKSICPPGSSLAENDCDQKKFEKEASEALCKLEEKLWEYEDKIERLTQENEKMKQEECMRKKCVQMMRMEDLKKCDEAETCEEEICCREKLVKKWIVEDRKLEALKKKCAEIQEEMMCTKAAKYDLEIAKVEAEYK